MTTNGWDNKRQMAGNGNDKWEETTENGEQQTQGMMNMGNNEQRGTGMTNGVVMSGSTPPSLQMRDGGAVLFCSLFLLLFSK